MTLQDLLNSFLEGVCLYNKDCFDNFDRNVNDETCEHGCAESYYESKWNNISEFNGLIFQVTLLLYTALCFCGPMIV